MISFFNYFQDIRDSALQDYNAAFTRYSLGIGCRMLFDSRWIGGLYGYYDYTTCNAFYADHSRRSNFKGGGSRYSTRSSPVFGNIRHTLNIGAELFTPIGHIIGNVYRNVVIAPHTDAEIKVYGTEKAYGCWAGDIKLGFHYKQLILAIGGYYEQRGIRHRQVMTRYRERELEKLNLYYGSSFELKYTRGWKTYGIKYTFDAIDQHRLSFTLQWPLLKLSSRDDKLHTKLCLKPTERYLRSQQVSKKGAEQLAKHFTLSRERFENKMSFNRPWDQQNDVVMLDPEKLMNKPWDHSRGSWDSSRSLMDNMLAAERDSVISASRVIAFREAFTSKHGENLASSLTATEVNIKKWGYVYRYALLPWHEKTALLPHPIGDSKEGGLKALCNDIEVVRCLIWDKLLSEDQIDGSDWEINQPFFTENNFELIKRFDECTDYFTQAERKLFEDIQNKNRKLGHQGDGNFNEVIAALHSSEWRNTPGFARNVELYGYRRPGIASRLIALHTIAMSGNITFLNDVDRVGSVPPSMQELLVFHNKRQAEFCSNLKWQRIALFLTDCNYHTRFNLLCFSNLKLNEKDTSLSDDLKDFICTIKEMRQLPIEVREEILKYFLVDYLKDNPSIQGLEEARNTILMAGVFDKENQKVNRLKGPEGYMLNHYGNYLFRYLEALNDKAYKEYILAPRNKYERLL